VIPFEKKFSREAILTIVLHSFFQFGGSMSFVFVNIYLWRLSHQLSTIAIYNLVCYLIVPIGFIIGGRIAKRWDRLVTYRLGIGFYALFYLSIVLAGDYVSAYYFLFAIAIGLAMGFYWSGVLVLMYDVTTDSNRLRFFSLSTVFFTLSGIIGTAVSGNIITSFSNTTGYLIVFGIALIVFLVTAIGSFQISVKQSRKKRFFLKYAFLLARKNKTWARAVLGFFIIGLLEGMIFFLPSILLYQSFTREDFVGYLVIFFSIISVVASYMLSKIGSNRSTYNIMLSSGMGIVLAASVLLTGYSGWAVVIFMMIQSFFNPWLLNSMTVYYFSLTDRLPLKGQFRIESVIVYESMMNMGRVVSISLFCIFVLMAKFVSAEVFLFSIACTQLLIVFCVDKKAVPGGGGIL
jgi:YQGE family putative transporter